MKKLITAACWLLSLSIILPLPALAFGQMTQPINITNAMRGQKINQELIIVNSDNKQIGVSFSAEGQIKDWVQFYQPKDLKTAVTTATIPAKSNLNMIAIIAVPDGVANGEYTGVISATNALDKDLNNDKASASLSQKIDRQVTVKVTDKENIKLAVSVIPENYDVALNEALKIRIIYDNQSNINLNPQISFKIKQGDQTVYNVIYPYPDGEETVNSMGQHEIPALSIPTTSLSKGKYLAQLQFMRGDQVLAEEEFGFSVGSNRAVLGTKIFNLYSGKLLLVVALALIIVLAFFGKQIKSKFISKKEATIKLRQSRKKMSNT